MIDRRGGPARADGARTGTGTRAAARTHARTHARSHAQSRAQRFRAAPARPMPLSPCCSVCCNVAPKALPQRGLLRFSAVAVLHLRSLPTALLFAAPCRITRARVARRAGRCTRPSSTSTLCAVALLPLLMQARACSRPPRSPRPRNHAYTSRAQVLARVPASAHIALTHSWCAARLSQALVAEGRSRARSIDVAVQLAQARAQPPDPARPACPRAVPRTIARCARPCIAHVLQCCCNIATRAMLLQHCNTCCKAQPRRGLLRVSASAMDCPWPAFQSHAAPFRSTPLTLARRLSQAIRCARAAPRALRLRVLPRISRRVHCAVVHACAAARLRRCTLAPLHDRYTFWRAAPHHNRFVSLVRCMWRHGASVLRFFLDSTILVAEMI
jgi:hypothetical protein